MSYRKVLKMTGRMKNIKNRRKLFRCWKKDKLHEKGEMATIPWEDVLKRLSSKDLGRAIIKRPLMLTHRFVSGFGRAGYIHVLGDLV